MIKLGEYNILPGNIRGTREASNRGFKETMNSSRARTCLAYFFVSGISQVPHDSALLIH